MLTEPSPAWLAKGEGKGRCSQHDLEQTGKLFDIAWKKKAKIRGMC